MCPIAQISQPKMKVNEIDSAFWHYIAYSIFFAKPNIESKNEEPIVMKAMITEKATKGWKMCWTDIQTILCQYQFDDVGDRGSGSSKRHNLLNVTNIQQVSILTWMLKPVSGKSRSNMIVITCPLSREYCSVLFL